MQLAELQLKRELKAIGKLNYGFGTELSNLLRERGWTVLGRGSEAAVAEHPSKPYVLKIYPTGSLYTKFVDLAQRVPQNPHFPKFSREQRKIPGTLFSYVRMEKLARVTEFDIKIEMPEAFCVAKQLYANLGQTLYWTNIDKDVIECSSLSRDAEEVVQLMTRQLKKIGPRLDLHPLNIMRRGTVWVITDPYF